MHSVKMIFASVFGFLLCFIAEKIHCMTILEPVTVNVTFLNCLPHETDCTFGCCPLENAVCCSDGIYCCPAGDVCIPFVGMCISAVNNNGDVALASEKAAPVRNDLSWCPPGMTDCNNGYCCPDNGVCCPDGLHCCKNGYTCDPTSQYCFKNTSTETGSVDVIRESASNMIRKSPYKFCPGENRVCPSYQICCTDNNGEKGCCPDPSLTHIQYGEGECCSTIFGNQCCPNAAPHCTVFGCA